MSVGQKQIDQGLEFLWWSTVLFTVMRCAFKHILKHKTLINFIIHEYGPLLLLLGWVGGGRRVAGGGEVRGVENHNWEL